MSEYDRDAMLQGLQAMLEDPDVIAYDERMRALPEIDGYVRQADLWAMLSEQMRGVVESLRELSERIDASERRREEIRAAAGGRG